MSDSDSSEYACEVHEVKSLPTGYDRCPYCVEEERIEAERRHMVTRDRTVEPW